MFVFPQAIHGTTFYLTQFHTSSLNYISAHQRTTKKTRYEAVFVASFIGQSFILVFEKNKVKIKPDLHVYLLILFQNISFCFINLSPRFKNKIN